jgi:hypothetical protein
MTLFPDTPIFEPQERESLKTNQYVRPYAAITKPQLVGLLIALGEYTCRVTTDQPPVMGTVDPELADKHRALVDFYRYGTRDNSVALSGQFVFDAQERSTLFLHKYVSHTCAILSKREVLILLEALERYSLIAPRIEQFFGPLTTAQAQLQIASSLRRTTAAINLAARAVRHRGTRCPGPYAQRQAYPAFDVLRWLGFLKKGNLDDKKQSVSTNNRVVCVKS